MLLLHSLSFPFVSSKIITETDKPLYPKKCVFPLC